MQHGAEIQCDAAKKQATQMSPVLIHAAASRLKAGE